MMNKTKLLALALALLCSISCFAGSRISVADLPKPAQTLLTKYFANVKVQKVEKDWDNGNVTYEVEMSDNTEIEFDAKGKWTEVSGKVPMGLIPKQIVNSVKNDYDNQRIVKIERERNGDYEVELSNGNEITYNKAFKVIAYAILVL